MGADPHDVLDHDQEARLARLRQALDAAGADYEILAHPKTVVSAEDGVERGFGTLAQMAPTFILETEAGYIAAIISGQDRLSYKQIKKGLGLRNVSLAKPEVVLRETGALVGTVSLVNSGLATIVDTRVTLVDSIFGGCGIPRHTLHITPQDLIRVTAARVFDFAEPKTGSA